MDEKRGIPANQQKSFSGQVNYSRTNNIPINYALPRRQPFYNQRYPQPPNKNVPPAYPKAWQQPDKNAPVKKKEKLIILILIILLVLVALGTILTLLFLIPPKSDEPGGERVGDRELFVGGGIDKAVVRDEKTAYVILDSSASLSKVSNVTLIFKSSDSEYTYFSKSIESTYKVSASDLGLKSFEDIISVDAVITFVTSSQNTTPNDTNLTPNNAGKCSIDCNYYYNIGKCGPLLSNGCSNSLSCLACNPGSYCYLGEGSNNICVDNSVKCTNSGVGNHYTKDNVTLNQQGAISFFEDFCSTNLTEFYCYYNGNSFEIRNRSYFCPYGCSNGACILPSCSSNINCTALNNVCSYGICNSSLKCEIQYNQTVVICRAASGECGLEEHCTGTSSECPEDSNSTGNICRASVGVCDVAEKCDGSSNRCLIESFNSSTVSCRQSAYECDETEFCLGNSAICPLDLNKSDGSACGAGICRSGRCGFTQKLVGYYNFEGNANDQIGGNNGVIYSATPTEGLSGQALYFDGIDDYVEVPYNRSVNLDNGFTISLWIMLQDQASNYPGIFWKNDTIILRYGPNEGNSFQGLIYNSGSLEPKVSFGPYTDKNKWYNIVLSYNPLEATDNLKLYINGELRSNSTKAGEIDPSHGSFYIGKYFESDYFRGKIDDLKIWNYAISSAEVRQEYFLHTPNNLIAYYSFDGNAKDIIGESDGIVYGASLGNGVLGQSYFFNGATDYIEIDNNGLLNSNKNFTILTWVYLQEPTFNSSIIFWKDNSFALEYSLVQKKFQGFIVTDNGNKIDVQSSKYLEYNKWYHIALTYKASDSSTNLKMFVNGQPDGYHYIGGYGHSVNASSFNPYIGKSGNGYFKGKIDELTIFGRDLNSDEIMEIYSGQQGSLSSFSFFNWLWRWVEDLFL